MVIYGLQMQALLWNVLLGTAFLHLTTSQPFQPGQNLIPLGKLSSPWTSKLRDEGEHRHSADA